MKVIIVILEEGFFLLLLGNLMVTRFAVDHVWHLTLMTLNSRVVEDLRDSWYGD